MDLDILAEALRRRKLKANKDLQDLSNVRDEDLDEKTTIIMGANLDEDLAQKTKDGSSNSTDDLAPSEQEMKGFKQAKEAKKEPMMDKPFKNSRPIDDGGTESDSVNESESMASDVGGSDDEAVFDQKLFNKMKNSKRKPRGLYERMQMSLGKKTNR